MGSNARGGPTQILRNPPCRPHALRRTTPREILEFLRARYLIGFPVSRHTDACLGHNTMGYQSWEVAYGLYDTRKFNLIRLVGPASTGHDAESMLTQEAKAGFRPCCIQSTHIAVPSSPKLGAYSELQELGMRLWANKGPWAARRLAAANYVLVSNRSPLPAGWNWAARSLDFNAPSPSSALFPVEPQSLFLLLRRMLRRNCPTIRIRTRE